jgi:hypothetical protein
MGQAGLQMKSEQVQEKAEKDAVTHRLKKLLPTCGAPEKLGRLFVLILLVVIFINSQIAPNYLTVGNQINLFILSIERVIVAVHTFLIINGEIDLRRHRLWASCLRHSFLLIRGRFRHRPAGQPVGWSLRHVQRFWIARVG